MDKRSTYENYASIRDANHLTDYQVAKLAGLSTSTLSRWKNNYFMPKTDKLLAICDVLGCPLEALLGIKPRYGYED